MIKKMIMFTMAFLLILSLSHFGTAANADHKETKRNKESYDPYRYEEEDDDDEDEDDHEKYEDDGEWEVNENEQGKDVRTKSLFWNVWIREPGIFANEDLPIQDARDVNMELNQQNEKFFIFPQNGQLLISGEKAAKFLGAKVEFYPQNKILVVSKEQNELIIRAGTNAAYENMEKIPMPSQALFYEKTVYLPISVLANALDYRVSWDAEKETILLQSIN